MGKIGFLFAGQGAQYPGMAKDMFEEVQEIRDFYGVAEAIRPGTLAQMFCGTKEELKKTENTQPCLFLADIAGAMALKKNGINPDAVAGFSLGETVAMAISGVLSPEEAFKLVCKRGQFMQDVAENVQGGMVAVLRMDNAKLEEMCEQAGVYPVNYNCPGQVVVSGKKDRIEKLKELLTLEKARFVELEVGGPFHTPYMQEASAQLKQEMEVNNIYNINKTYIPLYANKTAEPYPDDKEEMINIFSDQVSNSVRWEDTIRNMADDGVDSFIECGPGKTLSGFVKKTVPEARIFNVSDMESLRNVLENCR